MSKSELDTRTRIVQMPDILAAHWYEPSGTEFELGAAKGSSVVTFSMRPEGRTWTHTTVTNPERFGPIPRTVAQMRAYADAFRAAGTEDD